MTAERPGSGDYFGRDLEAMSAAGRYHRWILAEFRPFLGRRLVEVGAGSGSFTGLLQDTRPEWLVAAEPSRNMFPRLEGACRGLAGVTAVQGYLDDAAMAAPGPADTVLYVNVLEHVEDDLGEMERVRATLDRGGNVCVFVPALPALFSAFDEALGHWRRYTRRSLHDCLTRAGFEIVKSRYFDLFGVVPWWIVFRLLRRRGLGGAQVSLYDRWVVPVSRVVEGAIPPPVGKNLLVVARRRS